MLDYTHFFSLFLIVLPFYFRPLWSLISCTFQPAGMHAGTFDPYPSHADDKYTGIRYPRPVNIVNKSGKTFMPSAGPKSAPISSRHVNNPVRCGLSITCLMVTSDPGTHNAATRGKAAEEGSAGITHFWGFGGCGPTIETTGCWGFLRSVWTSTPAPNRISSVWSLIARIIWF